MKFDGGAGSNTLLVEGKSQADVFCVTDSTAGTTIDPQNRNSGQILHSTQVVYAPNAAPATDVVIDYASLQNLRIDGGDGNDYVTFHMATATTLIVKVDGGAGTNALRIVGSDGADQILVGNFGAAATAPVPYYDYDVKSGKYPLNLSKWTLLQRFQVQNVQGLVVDAGKGNDIVENNTAVPSLLLGRDGNDVLVGGDAADVIFGGPATDPTSAAQQRQELFGRGGSNWLLSDFDYDESKLDPAHPTDVNTAIKAVTPTRATCKNEVIDGSGGNSVAFCQGDLVLHYQMLIGGGGNLSTMGWLRRPPRTCGTRI